MKDDQQASPEWRLRQPRARGSQIVSTMTLKTDALFQELQTRFEGRMRAEQSVRSKEVEPKPGKVAIDFDKTVTRASRSATAGTRMSIVVG